MSQPMDNGGTVEIGGEVMTEAQFNAARFPLTTVGHTDEVREMVSAGEVKLGDKALDVPIASMTDREILEETLLHARNTRDTVTAFVDGFMVSPMGAMMTGGKLPPALAFLFGNGGGGV